MQYGRRKKANAGAVCLLDDDAILFFPGTGNDRQWAVECRDHGQFNIHWGAILFSCDDHSRDCGSLASWLCDIWGQSNLVTNSQETDSRNGSVVNGSKSHMPVPLKQVHLWTMPRIDVHICVCLSLGQWMSTRSLPSCGKQYKKVDYVAYVSHTQGQGHTSTNTNTKKSLRCCSAGHTIGPEEKGVARRERMGGISERAGWDAYDTSNKHIT
jgi:hypothetical protein